MGPAPAGSRLRSRRDAGATGHNVRERDAGERRANWCRVFFFLLQRGEDLAFAGGSAILIPQTERRSAACRNTAC
jgi:hypothetical protein